MSEKFLMPATAGGVTIQALSWRIFHNAGQQKNKSHHENKFAFAQGGFLFAGLREKLAASYGIGRVQ